MGANTGQARTKTNILTWRGLLASRIALLRWIIAIIVLMLSLVLTFTQLGFVGVDLPNGNIFYLVTLLICVALGALLLGTLTGAGVGCVAGIVLALHAQYLPLDHYELLFVTPIPTIVTFTALGFLMGIMFAIALRNNPSQLKSIIYIAIVSLIASFFYSVLFSLNAFYEIAVRIADYTGAAFADAFAQESVQTTFTGLGNVLVQILADAVNIAVICSLADFVVRKVAKHRGTLGFRAVFGIWLAVVVVLGFMGALALNFAFVSSDELIDAEDLMQSEVNYLCNQLTTDSRAAEKISMLFDEAGIDINNLNSDIFGEITSYFDSSDLLNGYTLSQDGTVIVLYDDVVALSCDRRFPLGGHVQDVFCNNMIEAIEKSADTGVMQRFVYEEASIKASNPMVDFDSNGNVQLAYIFARNMEHTNLDHKLIKCTVLMMQPSSQVFQKRAGVMVSMSLSALLLMFGAFIIVFFLLERVISRRIDEENEALALITAGDLNARATAGGTREFESLSDGINSTVSALKGWITEANDRIDAELEAARTIQVSAVPGTFPPYPSILKFDIYGSMNPARQVGGDFYDFFLIGDDWDNDHGKLGFVIADVSGKGVPGALLMMKAKTQIQNYVGSGMELGEAITEVNRQLVENNESGMFVTAWIGVLDYGTGHVEYVNAGHNPPLLWQRSAGWRWMRQRSGPIMGLFDIQYTAHSLDCRPGDTFLLYTDGVTEAYDVNEQLYGEKRLLEVADEAFTLHPRELLEAVRDDVARHSEGAEQSDDITILTLEVGVPPEITATLEVPAEVSELEHVNDFLHAELDRRLCSQRTQNQLDIAVEELFVNVCHYAYADAGAPGTVRIQRTYSDDPKGITVDIIDTGIPFNPLAKPDAVTPDNIADVPIGGLGILMAKKCVDDISYEYVDGCNIVTIVKRW